MVVLAPSPAPLAGQTGYRQTNLVSDIPGLANHTNSNLVNPWGISSGPTSPFWVSNAGTATSTLFNSTGNAIPLVVHIPGPGGSVPGVPTGQVFNSNATFNGDRFLFATETGTIAGWRGALGTTAETLVNNSAAGAAYFGVAIAQSGTNSTLYAADFGRGHIDAWDGGGGAANLSGNFSDPTLPSGYAPFNIQNVGGTLFVAYAQKAGDEEQPGPGLGVVNKFDLQGNLIGRFTSNGALNAPWGLSRLPVTSVSSPAIS